jgi:hypothetical protein
MDVLERKTIPELMQEIRKLEASSEKSAKTLNHIVIILVVSGVFNAPLINRVIEATFSYGHSMAVKVADRL